VTQTPTKTANRREKHYIIRPCRLPLCRLPYRFACRSALPLCRSLGEALPLACRLNPAACLP